MHPFPSVSVNLELDIWWVWVGVPFTLRTDTHMLKLHPSAVGVSVSSGWVDHAVGESDHTGDLERNLTSPIKTECSGESQLSTHHNSVLQGPLVVTTHSAPLAAVEDLHTTCCVIVSTYQTNCTLCGDGV